MADLAPYILAQSDDFQKFVFMIVVGAIIGIGSLISAAKKKQNEDEERQRHRENWERIQEEMRQRAANATRALSDEPGGYPQYAPPPPIPQQASTGVPQQESPYPAHASPPPPVFAPTRSIAGPYIPPPPTPSRQVRSRPVPVPARTIPVPPRPVQVRQPANQPTQRRPKKQKPPRLPPAPPMAPAASALPAAMPDATRSGDAPAASRAQPASSADAAALARWLTARTLRSQFILTEILQPPLALRPPADEAR